MPALTADNHRIRAENVTASEVAGFSEMPLFPAIAALLLAIGLLVAAWRREGR